MPTATLTSKGQITVPKAVREALGVSAGDRLAFQIHPDGRVTVEAATIELSSLFGIIKPTVRGVTIEQMQEAIERSGGRR